MRIVGDPHKDGGRHRSAVGIASLVACVVMVLVSATVIITAQGRSQRSEVEKRMGATSALAAAYVHEQTTGLGALVAAYADRPSLRGALEARPGDKAAAATVEALLDGLISARSGVTFTFLTDARGVALAVHPATPASIGKSFAFRDWYRGATTTRGPYISEAYQSRAVGLPFVVAASILVRSKPTAAGQGRVLGILAATYSLSSFQKFAGDYAARTGIDLLIVDKRGVLIADGGHPSKPGATLEERRAAGRLAISGKGGVLSAKTIDPGTGWTVVSEVPVDAALGPAASFRGVVLFAAALLIVLLVGGAGVGARIRRNRRMVDAVARESEERAQLERQRAREDVDRFFSLSLDLLCISSDDGYFKRLNPAWKDVLGYDEAELVEQPFASFIHPDDLAATGAEVGKLMDGVPTIAFENRFRCKDGSYRWLLWKATPLPDQGLMYAVARDNTERRRVEQASARLAAIVDSSVDAIVGAGLDGVVTSWNRGAEQIFGYRTDQVVGRPIGALALVGEETDVLGRAAEGEVIAPYEARGVRQDGQRIDVAVTTSPVRDPNGTVIGISMIARDISESTRTAAALRAIIATASDGFVSMDSGGLVTDWNHRAEALFGWSRDEAIGRELADLIIPAAQRAAHRGGLQRVLSGGSGGDSNVLDKLVEVDALHRDGRQIPVELAVWRVAAGPVEQFSAFVRDISARQQIARDVEAARDQAVEASRLKSAFLATMSHEIRTPMNGVIGLTALLLRGDLDDPQRRYAEGIRVAGDALLAVISDILDFSKIEAGALILDDAAVDLGVLLEQVVDLVAQSARAKSLELIGYRDPRMPAQLRGDPVRIRQILLNLATNAVKFTDHGEVLLRILLEEDSPAGMPPSASGFDIVGSDMVGSDILRVRFEVTDTGIGIEPADRDRLFDAFAQADASTTRRFGGTGLGLAICRELAEAMGGQIGVESQPGEGTTFWCSIPLRYDPTGEPVPAAPDASLDTRRGLVVADAGDTQPSPARPTRAPSAPNPAIPTLGRVLLVEDNEINQMVAEGILAQLGYSVDVAADGLQALELAATSTYKALLMDCQMPRMDGYETTGELRRREDMAREPAGAGGPMPARLPIIAMTAATLKEDRDRCLAAGMDDYLSKPIKADQLAAVLTRWTTGVPSVAPGSTSTERAITDRLDDLEEMAPGGLVPRLVTSFLKRAPGYLTDLRDAQHRGDADGFADAAHSLKGVAANLGATAVAALCDELETLGREDRLQAAPDLLSRLDVEYDAVRRIMEHLQSGLPSVRPAVSSQLADSRQTLG